MAKAPSGHGIYAWLPNLPRDLLDRADFLAVDATRPFSVDLADTYLRKGKKVYAFSGPAEWTPRGWREGLASALQFAQAHRCTGLIADPENNWPQGGSDAQAEELGRALASVASNSHFDVGLTSFPTMPRRQAFARGCRGAVWASPQLYAKDYGHTAYKRWHQEWSRLFGASAIAPGVSLWDSGDETDNIGPYKAYLNAIPASLGMIAWVTGAPAAWRADAYFAHSPSGGLAGWFRLFFSDPFLIALLLASALGLVLWVVNA